MFVSVLKFRFRRVGIKSNLTQVPVGSDFNLFVKYFVPLFSRTPFELLPPTRVNMAMRKKFIREESLIMDFSLELDKITCPTLQIAGDRDPTHPYVCAKATIECFPQGSFALVEDAGAPIYQDQPVIFASYAIPFIEKLIGGK